MVGAPAPKLCPARPASACSSSVSEYVALLCPHCGSRVPVESAVAVSQRCPKCRRTVKRVSRPPTDAEVVPIYAARLHPAARKRTVKRGAWGLDPIGVAAPQRDMVADTSVSEPGSLDEGPLSMAVGLPSDTRRAPFERDEGRPGAGASFVRCWRTMAPSRRPGSRRSRTCSTRSCPGRQWQRCR